MTQSEPRGAVPAPAPAARAQLPLSEPIQFAKLAENILAKSGGKICLLGKIKWVQDTENHQHVVQNARGDITEGAGR